MANTARGNKVTIYCKAPGGSIARTEGYLVRIEEHTCGGADVVFVKKGGKLECTVMSYYSPFWLVVDGWNHPTPDSLFMPAEPSATAGVEVARGRYRSCDPRWVSDFFAGTGAELKPRAMFKDGKLLDMTSN